MKTLVLVLIGSIVAICLLVVIWYFSILARLHFEEERWRSAAALAKKNHWTLAQLTSEMSDRETTLSKAEPSGYWLQDNEAFSTILEYRISIDLEFDRENRITRADVLETFSGP